MVLVRIASPAFIMSILTPPEPPRSEDSPDTAALIEEARQRARRRRRGYAAGTLAAAAAALLGFQGSGEGGETSDPRARAEQPVAAAAVARGDWRAVPGFEGGTVTALAFDERDPERLFATTLRGGVVKSSDGGRSWRALDIEASGGRFDALAVASQDPQTVYAAGSGIDKSTDGGVTWEAVDSGLFAKETAEEREHRRLEGFVSALAVDPRDADVVFASTGRGVLKSTNGGAIWRRSNLTSASALVLDPQNPDTLYAAGDGAAEDRGSTPTRSGVFKSSDGGESWHLVGLEGASVGALALDPRHPETIYAGTDKKGVIKSTDAGRSWRPAGLEVRYVGALMVDPQEPERVYALADGRIFLSTNGGDAWRALDAEWGPDFWAGALALNPRDPATMYVGASMTDNGNDGAGVYKSLDGGDSWRPMNAGLTDARVSALALDPRSPGTAYAAVDGRGVFERADGRWRAAITGLSVGAHSAAVDPQHPATIYVAAYEGVFRSTNGGTGWSEGPLHEPTGSSALAVDAQNPTTVYATGVDEAVGGRSARIYTSTLYKSTDAGVSWPATSDVQTFELPAASSSDQAPPVREAPLAVDPAHAQTLYVGGLGVRKSVDGGHTWQSAGLTREVILALAVDPEKPASVYAGTDAGLFTSTDAGASWRAMEGPLDGARVEAIAIDPRGRGTVYAGTDRGVFWTADDGRSWRRFTRLPVRPFDALAVDTTADLVYAGSYGGGLFELDLSP
jgi:photosystem II stability/assembly factor-like uncharacterized protein